MLKLTHRLEEGCFQMEQHLPLTSRSTSAISYRIESHYLKDDNVVSNFTTSHTKSLYDVSKESEKRG